MGVMISIKHSEMPRDAHSSLFKENNCQNNRATIPFFDIKVTLGKTFNAYEAKIIYLLVLFAKDIPGNR